jgi:hypothetical protein
LVLIIGRIWLVGLSGPLIFEQAKLVYIDADCLVLVAWLHQRDSCDTQFAQTGIETVHRPQLRKMWTNFLTEVVQHSVRWIGCRKYLRIDITSVARGFSDIVFECVLYFLSISYRYTGWRSHINAEILNVPSAKALRQLASTRMCCGTGAIGLVDFST